MPPKPALTSSFLVSSDAENEVVCPLFNQDGSQCRKRCIGVRSSSPFSCLMDRVGNAKTDSKPTGKTLPVDARTHPTRPPRSLYSQTPGYRGEFSSDDKHAPFATTPDSTWPTHTRPKGTLYVGLLPLVLLCMILSRTADASENVALLEQTGAGALQPPAANAAATLTQMQTWDTDFVSIRHGDKVTFRPHFAHSRPRMSSQIQTTSATFLRASNFPRCEPRSTKTRSHHSNPPAHANYYLLFSSLLEADTHHCLPYNDAASDYPESRRWAKTLAKANTNAENLGSFRPRSFPAD
jgi:hypothetical protein